MRDTIAQTRFENVSKLSNDSLLARGNTLQSDEDRLKLNDLMELCTNLQKRVLDLEKTKTTQANEITFLKRRVKKLENKDRSRTHKLKRLYKGRRINAIDADEDITLVNVEDDADNEMFDMNALNGEEMFVAGQNENVVKDVVDAAQDKGKGIMVEEPVKTMKKKDLIRLDKEFASKLQDEFDEEERLAREKAEKEKESNVALIEEWDDIQAKIEVDHELDQRLQAEEQEELSVKEKAKLFQQLLEQRRKHFAAKSAKENRNKPPTQAQQRKIMCTYPKKMEGKKPKDLKNKSFDCIQKLFDRAFKRVNTFINFKTDLVEGSSKRAGEELEQESTKKQKVDEDKDKTELQSLMEVIPDEKEVTIDVVPLATKSPRIVDEKIHKEGKKSNYQIIRVDGKSKIPVEDMDLLLWNDMKIMFQPYIKDEVWKLQNGYKVLEWKLYDSYGGVEGPIFQDPPSPDYVPSPEEPKQAPPSPIYPEFLPVDNEVFPAEEQPMPAADSPTHQSPGYIPESDPEEDPEEDDEEDPEEDPADYPADRGDDDDDTEEEHSAPADPAAVAYSADQDPYLAYRITARMSIRPHAPAPFLSEEVAERLLALPTPPPSPLSPYSSPLPQIPSPPLPIPSPPPNGPTYVEGSLGSRAAGIRQRDALPYPIHETEMPEICLPLRKRPRRTTPGPGCEVGE
ncbi:hypothetical protein Tco_0353284, partial [Tanacetum coccineum]